VNKTNKTAVNTNSEYDVNTSYRTNIPSSSIIWNVILPWPCSLKWSQDRIYRDSLRRIPGVFHVCQIPRRTTGGPLVWNFSKCRPYRFYYRILSHRIHVCYIYMVTFTINIPPMLPYIAYMDPMGIETWHLLKGLDCWPTRFFFWWVKIASHPDDTIPINPKHGAYCHLAYGFQWIMALSTLVAGFKDSQLIAIILVQHLMKMCIYRWIAACEKHQGTDKKALQLARIALFGDWKRPHWHDPAMNRGHSWPYFHRRTWLKLPLELCWIPGWVEPLGLL